MVTNPTSTTTQSSRANAWRARYYVTSVSKSLSKSAKFYDALRFLCSAVVAVIFLKLLLMSTGSSHATSSSVGDSNINYQPASINTSDLGNQSKQTIDENFRVPTLASALSQWQTGPIPDSVVQLAADCTPRDAAEAVMRSIYNIVPVSVPTGNITAEHKQPYRAGGVVDIGANGGYPVTRLALKQDFGWVLSVDPDARNFHRLTKLRVSGKNTRYIAVFGAISAKSGSISMRYHRDRDDFSCVSCLDNKSSEVYTRVVDAFSLDELLLDPKTLSKAHTHKDIPLSFKKKSPSFEFGSSNDENDVKVELLKTDTQGHEPQVLSGCSRLFSEERIKYAIIEFDTKLLHSKENARAVVVALLDAGMQCVHLQFAGKDLKNSSTTVKVDENYEGENGREKRTSFSRAIALENVDEFVDFVNSTGRYTDLFCSKRPPKAIEGEKI